MNKDEAKKHGRNHLTEYQRARTKFLPAGTESSGEKSSSSEQAEPNDRQEHKSRPSQRHNNRYNNSLSPIEHQRARRNGNGMRETEVAGFNYDHVPNNKAVLDVAIS
jgi:hypothetical protein